MDVTIKFFVSIETQHDAARKTELKYLKQSLIYTAVNLTVMTVTPILVTFGTLMVYVYLGNKVTVCRVHFKSKSRIEVNNENAFSLLCTLARNSVVTLTVSMNCFPQSRPQVCFRPLHC